MTTFPRSLDVPSTFLTKHNAAKLYKVSRVTLDRRLKSNKLSTTTDASGRVFLDPSELERLFGARDSAKSDVVWLSDEEVKAAAESVAIAEDAAQVAKQEVDRIQRELDKANAENAGLLKTVALVEDMRKDRDSEMSRAVSSHKDELARLQKQKDDELSRVLADKEEIQNELKAQRSKGFFGRVFGS